MNDKKYSQYTVKVYWVQKYPEDITDVFDWSEPEELDLTEAKNELDRIMKL